MERLTCEAGWFSWFLRWQVVVHLTGHPSGHLPVLGITLLTSDLLPKPRAQITSCLLDIPLGSLKPPTSTCDALPTPHLLHLSLSRFSNQLLKPKKEKGKSGSCPWFLSFTPHPGHPRC